MKTYIALLRGINVSGQKKILMKDLISFMTEIGLQNINTYIQSGNIVFQSSETTEELIKAIQDKIK